MEAPIQLILADDHRIYRDGLKLLLQDQQDIQLVGEAENGSQLLELVDRLYPDIVLTDIKMPLIDGVQASRLLHQRHPDVGIIALSFFSDDQLIVDMLEAGARGYLLKNTNKQELLQAVKVVYEGG